MKNTFKKTGCILLCCLLASAAAMAANDTLYVAKNNGIVTVYPVNDVSALTFTDSTLVVNLLTGEARAVLFSNLRGFALTEFTWLSISNPPTGVASAANEAAVTVYPNPAGDLVTVIGEHNITSVALYNLIGQKLLQLEAANVNTVTVPLAKYPAGIYLLQVTTEKGIVTKKVVKE